MDNKKVSIIVPVYNVERFLLRCIDSLLAQTYKNFELIFVDDGSTDNSLEILRQAEKKDSRIKVYTQENSGPSAARNKGIEVSIGDYIMFCDSDDEVSANWCEKLVEGIEKYPKAWVMCEIAIVDEKSIEIGKYSYKQNNVLLPKENYYTIFQKGLSGSVYNKIFLAEVISNNKILFDLKHHRGEDVMFNLEYLENCQDIYVVSDSTYFYYKYDSVDTLTNRPRKDDFELHLMLYEKRLPFIASKYLKQFQRYYWNVLFSCMIKYMDQKFGNLIDRIRVNNRRLRQASFLALVDEFAKSEMNPMCYKCLKNNNFFGYWLFEGISKAKTKLFNYS